MLKKRLGAALLSLCLLSGTAVPAWAENTASETDILSSEETSALPEAPEESGTPEPLEEAAASVRSIVAQGVCGDDLTWALTDDGTLTVSGSGPMYDYEFQTGNTSTIPLHQQRYRIKRVIVDEGVTSIGEYAFNAFLKLTEVRLPDSLVQIKQSAFSNCSALQSIVIPIGVKTIGAHAFYCCTQLGNVKILSSETIIVNPADKPTLVSDVFNSCDLKSAGPIGSGCDIEFAWKDEIPNRAFDGCQSLESIIFPSGLKRIGENAFNQCMALKSAVIPESVTVIGYSAFSLCKSLSKVVVPENAVFTYREPTPEGGYIVTGGFAFASCESLLTAGPIGSGCNIEYGWTDAIPEDAFRGCESLSSVIIPVSITSIGRGAFQQTGIKEIYYMGSKEQWQAVNYVGAAVLDPMPTAKIYYNGVRPAPSVPIAPPVQTGPFTVVTANLSALASIAPASGKAPLVLAAPKTGSALSGQVNASTGEIAFQGQLESGNKLFFLEPDTYIPLARPSVLP